jgi:hypothetical protein
MDLDNLFVSDLLDTLVGQTDDDRSTTQALGEDGDQPEDTWDTEPVSTTQALGEDGDQPEDTWDTEPVSTTQALGEDGDQPEPDGPAEQGIWAGEDGTGGGCVVDEDDTYEPDECEPADEDETGDEGDEPADTNDPLNCW